MIESKKRLEEIQIKLDILTHFAEMQKISEKADSNISQKTSESRYNDVKLPIRDEFGINNKNKLKDQR